MQTGKEILRPKPVLLPRVIIAFLLISDMFFYIVSTGRHRKCANCVSMYVLFRKSLGDRNLCGVMGDRSTRLSALIRKKKNTLWPCLDEVDIWGMGAMKDRDYGEHTISITSLFLPVLNKQASWIVDMTTSRKGRNRNTYLSRQNKGESAHGALPHF
jgi:hypothetical protein